MRYGEVEITFIIDKWTYYFKVMPFNLKNVKGDLPENDEQSFCLLDRKELKDVR